MYSIRVSFKAGGIILRLPICAAYPSICRQGYRVYAHPDKTKFTAKEAANLVNGKAVCKQEAGKENWFYTMPPELEQMATTKSFNLSSKADF
jgi:hypothetical protein